jgi:hypothetical protein
VPMLPERLHLVSEGRPETFPYRPSTSIAKIRLFEPICDKLISLGTCPRSSIPFANRCTRSATHDRPQRSFCHGFRRAEVNQRGPGIPKDSGTSPRKSCRRNAKPSCHLSLRTSRRDGVGQTAAHVAQMPPDSWPRQPSTPEPPPDGGPFRKVLQRDPNDFGRLLTQPETKVGKPLGPPALRTASYRTAPSFRSAAWTSDDYCRRRHGQSSDLLGGESLSAHHNERAPRMGADESGSVQKRPDSVQAVKLKNEYRAEWRVG